MGRRCLAARRPSSMASPVAGVLRRRPAPGASRLRPPGQRCRDRRSPESSRRPGRLQLRDADPRSRRARVQHRRPPSPGCEPRETGEARAAAPRSARPRRRARRARARGNPAAAQRVELLRANAGVRLRRARRRSSVASSSSIRQRHRRPSSASRSHGEAGCRRCSRWCRSRLRSRRSERPAKNFSATSSRSRGAELGHRRCAAPRGGSPTSVRVGGVGRSGSGGLVGQLCVAPAAAKLVERGVAGDPEQPGPRRPRLGRSCAACARRARRRARSRPRPRPGRGACPAT